MLLIGRGDYRQGKFLIIMLNYANWYSGQCDYSCNKLTKFEDESLTGFRYALNPNIRLIVGQYTVSVDHFIVVFQVISFLGLSTDAKAIDDNVGDVAFL